MADKADIQRDAISMFFSAAIFGFFGVWLQQGPYPPELFLLMIWSLRGGAIGYALAGVLALAGLPLSRLLYAAVGGLTAVAFIVVGLWHLVAGLSALTGGLFLFFGVYNGHGVWRMFKGPAARDSKG